VHSQHQHQGKFKKQLGLWDLVFVGFGAIFGSGWLLSASQVASIAGPAGWISWVIGGVAVILLGLVYAELGGAVPRAGAVVRYPGYSHGPLVGYLAAFATLIAFSSLCAIEVEAARQYAASWWPALGATSPTVLGWFFQVALLTLFFLLNYWSVKTFAKANTVLTLLKFIVPTLTIIVLLMQVKGANFHAHGFAPFGVSGVEAAISTGGVIFAYLGLQPVVGFASEAKNPQRTVPIAVMASIILSTVVYALLQIAFVGSIPAHYLNSGWSDIAHQFNLPYRDIAIALGFGWLAVLVTLDAIISPSGCANIFLSSSARVVFGWARNRTLFQWFAQIDEQSGVPRPALWLSFLMSIFWTLPFPSWGALISVVSSALIFTYALAPISAYAFRLRAPDLPRPFYLKGMSVVGPLSFIVASLIVYWAGWKTDSWLLGVQLVMFVIYLLARRFVPTDQVGLTEQVKASLWLVFYYVAVIILSGLGTFGGSHLIAGPWDQILVIAVAIVAYYWGGHAGLARPIFDEDAVEA
jgi:amino acid transporter